MNILISKIPNRTLSYSFICKHSFAYHLCKPSATHYSYDCEQDKRGLCPHGTSLIDKETIF